MTDERKIQIPVVVDGTGAKQGFSEVKAAAQDMAQAVSQAGVTASKGVDSIGAGAPAAAAKVDGATRSLIGSIQRTTAVMEAGGRTTAKYYEALAAQRGVSLDALKPYLAQLDAVSAKQGAATAALNTGAAGLKNVGMSAAATTAALRQVPAQFTDIVVSLSAGQRPLQVLLQQGGQLKDVFGGIGPAAAALGGYVKGLINPFTLAAGALGITAVALHKGSEELIGFQKAAILTGNAIGISAGQFSSLRDSIAGIAGTKGKAAEVLTEIAANGKIAGTNVRGIAEAAILMEKATGQAISKTVEQFATLAQEPVKASLKLNEQYNYLTMATYRQIKALEDQGKATQAANLAEETYANALKSRAALVIENAGLIEKSWKGIANVAKGAWDAMLGIGRETTSSDRLASAAADVARIQAQLAGVGTFSETGGGAATGGASAGRKVALEQELRGAREALTLAFRRNEIEQQNSFAKAEQNRLEQLGIQYLKDGDQYLTRAQQRDKEINAERVRGQELINAGKLTQIQLDARIAAINLKYKDPKSSGAAAPGESEVARLNARQIEREEYLRRLKSTPIGEGVVQQTQAEKDVLRLQEDLKTSIKGVTREQKEKALAVALATVETDKAVIVEERYRKAMEASIATLEKQTDAVFAQALSIRDQAIAQEAVNANFGKGKTAIEQSVLAQMDLQLVEAESAQFAPAFVAALETKRAAQERYVAALQKTELKEAALRLTEAGRVGKEEAATLQLELSLLGQSQQVRERIIGQRKVEVALAKELERIQKLNIGTGPEAEVERQKLVDQARANAIVEVNNVAQKSVTDEWLRTTDKLYADLSDSLQRGFEKGKGFAKGFFDSLVATAKRMVIEFAVKGTMSLASGQQNDSALSVLSRGAPGGSASNLTSIAGAGFQYLTGATAGASSASLVGANAVGALGGDAIGTLAALNGGWAGVSTATTAGATAMTGAASAIGTAATTFAAAIPYIGLAVAAISLLMKKGGGPKADGQAGVFGDIKNSLGGQIVAGNKNELGEALKPALKGLQSQYDDLARQFGSKAAVTFGLAISRDPKGNSPTFLEATAQKDGKELFSNLNRNVGRSDEDLSNALATATADALIGALKAGGLDKPFADFFDKIASDASTEAKQTAIATAQAVKSYTEQVKFLGEAFGPLKEQSVEVRAALIAAAGGLEALSNATASYYQNFYSEVERQNNVVNQVASELERIGYSNVTTVEGFRALVDQSIAAGQAGHGLYLELLGIQDAFNAVYGAAGILKTRLKEVAADAFGTLQRSVDAERKRITASYDAAVKSAEKQLDALPKSIAKVDSLASALASALSSYRTSPTGLSRNEAAGQIQTAVVIAKASGTLPDADSLKDALSVLTQPNEQLYATFADYVAARDIEAASLGALNTLTKTQLSVEQRTLDALKESLKVAESTRDTQLDYLDAVIASAQLQMDAINGVNTSVLLVRDAISAFNRASVPAGGGPIQPAGGSFSGGVVTSSGNLISEGDIGRFVQDAQQAAGIATAFLENLGRAPSSSDYAYYEARLDAGQVLQDIIDSIKASPEYANGSHADGLWNVPFNGYKAITHAGEAILPKPMADAWRAQVQGGGDSQAVRELTAQVVTLQTQLAEISLKLDTTNVNTGTSARVASGIEAGQITQMVETAA